MLCTCSQNYSDMCRTCDEYANNMADVDMDPGPSDSWQRPPRSRRRGPGRRPPGPCPGPTGNLATGTNRPCTASSPCREPAGPRRCCSFSQVLTFKHRACSNYHDIFKFFVCKKRFHVCSCSLMFSMFSACSGHVHKA